MRVDVGSAPSVDIVQRRFHMYRTTLRQSMSVHLDLCVPCARNNVQQGMLWWSTNPDFINKNNSNLFPDLDLRIQQLMSRGQDGVWQCHHCEYTTKARQGMVNHIESRHVESNGVACQFVPESVQPATLCRCMSSGSIRHSSKCDLFFCTTTLYHDLF